MFNQNMNKRNYTNLKKIGSGAYGKVYSAKTFNGEKVAIKEIFDLRNIIDSIKLIREIQMLKHFNKYKHPNIIGIKDAYIKDTSFGKMKSFARIRTTSSKHCYERVCIVSDLYDTDLHKLIHRYRLDTPKTRFTDRHYEYFASQLVSGLYYLATADIIHRDLKPSNIILNADCSLKIIDFGLSRTKNTDGIARGQTDYVVTRWYRSPEIILYNPQYGYNKQVDIWGLGCILAEMILKRPLFDGEDYKDQLKKIFQFIEMTDNDFKYLTQLRNKPTTIAFINNYKLTNSSQTFNERFKELYRSCFVADNGKEVKIPETNDEFIHLIEKMLIINPNKRITIEELIKNPYFKSLCKIPNSPKSDNEYGAIPLITSPKRFKINYDFEEELIERDNINDVKEKIYDEVKIFTTEKKFKSLYL